ncbi:MAG: T9SS type A sorting domain-containing protein [Flavobacteriales bacterium]|nr:T9SS type A sorting domain-containing protein [Flavobacteriales bacterium]
MRSILTLVVMLPVFAVAQITIGPTDMPTAGDTVRYRTTSAAGLDYASTEAGIIWDFSMLTPDTEGADTCVTVASTPLLYQFFFNNGILYPQHQASHAQRGPSFGFQQLTVNDVFEYFKNDAIGFRNVGFGANVNGVPASTRRIPVDWVHRFPLEYGDMDTSYSEFTLNVPSLFSFTQKQTRYNEVDGWGTLYLPADTFDVLRVKSTLERNDSIFISQFGQGFSFPEPETVEYKWIALGMDGPVLQINVNAGQATTARFYYQPDDITLSAPSSVESARLIVAPNPANESVMFQLPGDPGVLTLHDAQGRQVRSLRVGKGSAQLRISVTDLAPGAYLARLSNAEGAHVARVMVEH